MPDRVKVDDPFRDTVAQPEPQPGSVVTVEEQEADAQIVTDPTVQAATQSVTFTVPAAAQGAALAATPAVTIPDESATVTSVTYTPASTITPASGNGRTWTLTGPLGNVVGTLTVTNPGVLTGGAAAAFSLTSFTHWADADEAAFTLASSISGAGVADPGGTLTVTYTL